MMNRSQYDRSRHQMGHQLADRGEGYPRDEDRYDLQSSMYDEDERFQHMPSQQFGGYRNQDVRGRHDMGDQNFAGERYGTEGREHWGSSNQGPGMGQGYWGPRYENVGGQNRWQGYPGWRGNAGQDFSSYDRYGGYGGQTYGGQGYGQGPTGHGWGQQRRQWRAPKGYTRSDERIREEVCDRLGMEFDARDVEVKVTDGEVTLTGGVRDRSEKYHMEELVEGLGGVKTVHNLLQVKREGEETSAHSSSMSGRSGIEDAGRNVKRPQPSAQH
jgi:osmotically-inducible protein OsmY